MSKGHGATPRGVCGHGGGRVEFHSTKLGKRAAVTIGHGERSSRLFENPVKVKNSQKVDIAQNAQNNSPNQCPGGWEVTNGSQWKCPMIGAEVPNWTNLGFMTADLWQEAVPREAVNGQFVCPAFPSRQSSS